MSIVAQRSIVAVLLLLLGSALGLIPGAPPALQVPEDDEDVAYREAMVRKSLEENCLICHTEDLIASQRLTPAQWKAEVEKMVNWGQRRMPGFQLTMSAQDQGDVLAWLRRRAYPDPGGP